MYFTSWLPPTHVNGLLAGTDLCQVCTLLCLSCLQDMVGTQILATGMKNKGLSWDLAIIVKDTVYLWAPWSLLGHLSHWLPLSNRRQSHDQPHLVKEGSHGGPYLSRAHRVGWGLGALVWWKDLVPNLRELVQGENTPAVTAIALTMKSRCCPCWILLSSLSLLICTYSAAVALSHFIFLSTIVS